MNPEEREDIAYEMNRELGGLEQREIDRRVRRAREQRVSSETTEEGR